MAIDSPGSKSEILKLASEYLENDNPGKAIKLLENTEISESDADIQHMLAVAYADRKWGKKALAQYKKCLSGSSIAPALILDFSEFMLDSEEHEALAEELFGLLEDPKIGSDKELSAMCIAMLCSTLGDCRANKIETPLSEDFLKDYFKKHPEAADKTFCASVIKHISETPNDLSFTALADRIIKAMSDSVPALLSDAAFQHAVAELEISLMLYANMVDPLTVLGMRTAKLKFAGTSEDRDQLKYLVFDAKMTIVDTLRIKKLDVKRFQSLFPYIWSLISGFVNGALKTKDLKKFTRDEIYSELKNASPRLIKIFEKNLSADGFAALKNFLSSPASVPRPALYSGNMKIRNRNQAVSTKIAPNSPCPCGSGKKYKKCCGLK